MLTCEQLIESLADYLEGRLSLSRNAAFKLHLLCCDHCRSYLHNYEATIAATQQAVRLAEADAGPIEVPEELIAEILMARHAMGGEPPSDPPDSPV
jgi:anti-sigma factor RsiW